MTDYDILIRERDEARADRDGYKDRLNRIYKDLGCSKGGSIEDSIDILIREGARMKTARGRAYAEVRTLRADRDGLIEAIGNACRVAGVSLATPRNPGADIERLGSMARDWWDRGQAAESRHAKSLADARLAAHRDGVLQGTAERDRLHGERDLARTHTEILRGAHRNARKTASMDPPDETSHAHGIEGLGREIVKLLRERSVARALQGNSHVRALATTHGEALVEVPYTTKPDVGDVVRGGWARAEHEEKTDGR